MYSTLLASFLTDNVVLLILLGVFVVFMAIIVSLVPISIWFRALVSGAHVSMGRLIGMKLRKITIATIIDAYITSKKAGLDISINDLETHYMAGGNVTKVAYALIAAHSARLSLTYDAAKAIDLAGRDVLAAVQGSVKPRVIETPGFITAVAKNGIELKVKARVTLRSNIGRLIGGAGEETILARVGEGIVTTVGSALNHKDILQNPDLISKTVLAKSLDAGTAFEILSIDVADIDVGRNVGADLDIEKAEADKKIAQAKAEERKAMAIAVEQEMRAKTQEMRASVLQAEAEVPRAIAEAFREGKLGIMDYYRMQNMVADTDMRKALSGAEGTVRKPIK